jgi:hypothetical protein
MFDSEDGAYHLFPYTHSCRGGPAPSAHGAQVVVELTRRTRFAESPADNWLTIGGGWGWFGVAVSGRKA